MQGLETDPLALRAQHAVRTDCRQGQEWLLWETGVRETYSEKQFGLPPQSFPEALSKIRPKI